MHKVAAKSCNWHCSIQVEAPNISLVISPQWLYEQVYNIAQMFLHISKHGTVASLLSVITVVSQSPTLTS